MNTEDLREALNKLQKEDPWFFRDLVEEILKECLTAHITTFGSKIKLDWEYSPN